MILRRGIIRDGQVVVDEPINLPDESEVTITGRPHEKFVGCEDNDRPSTPEEIATELAAFDNAERSDIPFLTEDEQSDDPEAVRQWVDDLRSIPPLPDPPDHAAAGWEDAMREFNLNAVQRQFEEGER